MRKPIFRFWVLGFFLFGVSILVFLQVMSNNAIKGLIHGNRQLMQEIALQNQLRKLETDLLTIESDIRGAVITNNKDHLDHVNEKINSVDQSIESLKTSHKSGFPQQNLQILEQLVNEKLAFSHSILNAYAYNKEAAETVINTLKGQILRDSITNVIGTLDSIRQRELITIVSDLEASRENARLWAVFITVIAIISVSGSFWYILNQGRKQENTIRLLNASEKRSKELASIKEQFLANMSHEIRTPLNSILGFTNLLRRSKLDEDQRKYVQNIHTAGENLFALVNDILDLSKIEAGMMVLEESRFSLHSLVSSVGAMFSEKVKEKGLSLKVQIDDDVPDILSGDAVRLTQILVNLISNGVKFTDAGYVQVNIGVVNATEELATIRIAIVDTGIGISKNKQNTIFERFQQAETETTRRFGGSGLGLSIVKQLVDLQQGRIWLDSEPGKGSTFYVELTYKLPDINQLYSEALAMQEEAVPVQRIKVLIAEDNQMNQMLISHLMKSWGIEFVLVNNGEEAVREVQENQYSIVLMDIQMPEMDGYTATSVIRNELKMDIPIIAMTAHAMVGEKEKCMKLGMNDYVSKPLKETVLYNIIARNAQHISEPGVTLDLQQLHQLSGGDQNFEKEMLSQFIIQVEEELQKLQRSIEEKDYRHVRSFAHSLKSTVGYIGLDEELNPYLQQLEDGANEEDEDAMQETFNHVYSRCMQAKSHVQSLLSHSFL